MMGGGFAMKEVMNLTLLQQLLSGFACSSRVLAPRVQEVSMVCMDHAFLNSAILVQS